MMLNYPLQSLSLVRVDDDVTQLLLRLNTVTHIDVLNIHINLQIYIQRHLIGQLKAP